MNERVKQIYNYLLSKRLVYNQTDFSAIIEKSKTTTSQILSGKTGVTKKTAETLCAKFPEISLSWLLTGEGMMIKQETTQDNSFKISLENIGNIDMGNSSVAASTADARIAALEAENARLKEEVSWLRSLINK